MNDVSEALLEAAKGIRCDGYFHTAKVLVQAVKKFNKTQTENERLREALEWVCSRLIFGENKRFVEQFPDLAHFAWTPDDDDEEEWL
jgi:hypothetical protein